MSEGAMAKFMKYNSEVEKAIVVDMPEKDDRQGCKNNRIKNIG